jgi:hypothetical protein
VKGKVITSGRSEVVGRGDRRVSRMQKCVQMYVNAKMVLVEIILGMREGAIYLIHCKNIYKC